MSHNPLSDLENLYENVKNNFYLSKFSHVDFDKLCKVVKNKVEEALYVMMEKFKTTQLEFSNSMPKTLYDIIEKKWHYCLNMEKQIRKTTLAQVIPELTKAQIAKVVKNYVVRFTPKYISFSILQNNIEDIVKKSTQICKVTYGLTIVKKREPKPIWSMMKMMMRKIK